MLSAAVVIGFLRVNTAGTVVLHRLEHLWDHRNLF